MIEAMSPCPACGGSGGGPFGPAGSAWDIESYACLRCGGDGVVAAEPALVAEARPLAKGTARRPDLVADKRGPVSTRPAAETVTRTAGGNKK
jgi:hypothetical protein